MNNNKYKFLLQGFLLVALLSSGLVHGAQLLQLDEKTTHLTLDEGQVSTYFDAEDNTPLTQLMQQKDLLFTPFEEKVPEASAPSANGSLWVHFSIQSQSIEAGAETFLLEVDYAMLARAEIVIAANNEIVQQIDIGYSRQISHRILPYRSFVQPISLTPGITYDVFINGKRSNGIVKIPVEIHRPLTFIVNEFKANYALGILFGMLLAMAIYNAFVFISVRERVYLYYIAYILSCGTISLALTGIGNLLLWGQFPIVNEYISSISICLACISAIMFTRHFVRREYYSVFIDRLMLSFSWVGIGLIIYKVISGRYISNEIVLYLSALCAITPFALIHAWRKGSRSAGYFLLSWSVFLTFTITHMLDYANLIPSNIFTKNGMLNGVALQMLLLSFALADQINRAKKAEYVALREKHDTTLELQEVRQNLMARALHNGSTGLPNRAFLKSKLDTLVDQSTSPEFSLVLFSLNNFHEINKTFGHSYGEQVLAAFLDRLRSIAKELPEVITIECSSDRKEHLAVTEGVTFGLIVNEIREDRLLHFGFQLITGIEQPFEFDGFSLNIDASVGIALCTDHSINGERLLRNAHVALEKATESTHKVIVYSSKIDCYDQRRISLIGDLKKAIESDQLQLCFQPQIHQKTRSLAGLEALLRWQHPIHGFVPPDEFIPLAERSGVIRALTYWVINRAFEFKRELDRRGLRLTMSINISARNLQEVNFKDRVSALARKHSINLNEITMELTETALMVDFNLARTVMTELHQQGVRWSIDDYGTGQASLSYIRKLPVQEIKIDRSFVTDMVKNRDDQVIVCTTLLMAKSLNLHSVAEGIEDEVTLVELEQLGCDLAQGYHIARPMPADDFWPWLASYQPNSNPLTLLKG